jgi:hypothetical protein
MGQSGAERRRGIRYMVKTRWTPKEDALFRTMAESSARPEIIAAKLNRSVHAKAHADVFSDRVGGKFGVGAK